jgi:NAD(P)-dependent dehydrogenase (short-subunit alcohol dehydrogenase family)
MKRAMITGGSGLIGRTLCRRLAEQGWQVASFDVSPSQAPAHPAITAVQCDISDEGAVAQAVRGLGWDRLDLLVNNGGATSPLYQDLETTPLSAWNAMIGSHLTGAFLLSRAAAPLMQDGGSIVMMTSTRALMSEGKDFAYAAAKGGLIGLTQALAVALGPKIRVNAIAPGWISDAPDLSPEDHAQHPVGRVGIPDDIADAVLYLAGAGFISGQTLTVDGGMTKKMIYAE